MCDNDAIGPLRSGDMYSAAFQFYSHISASVDPRTGMFGASVDLASGEGNKLRGPHFPFRLSFSPLSTTNVGFGEGWNLAVTELNLDDLILTLSSGDSHKVEDLRAGVPATFPDRKLDSCSLVMNDADFTTADVEHITGVVEHLELMEGSPQRLCTTRITNPSGDSLHLAWERVANGLQCLTRITDDDGQVLLSIDYRTDDLVEATFRLGDADLTLDFLLYGPELSTVTIPLVAELNVEPVTDDNVAEWRFEYRIHESIRLLEGVAYPDGTRDEVEYAVSALKLPEGAPREFMPAVERLFRWNAASTDIIKESRYTYANHGEANFYGHPAVRQWENGTDQLLHLIGEDAFRYGSTESQYHQDVLLTTIERDYNHYHLAVLERTTRGNVVQEAVTEYGAIPDLPFERQKKSFQLPHKVTTTSFDLRQPGLMQTSYVESTYEDDSANVLTRYDSATGITEFSTYYPAEGEIDEDGSERCPPDPLGLVRRLKSQYAEPGIGGGEIRGTHYRYGRVPVRLDASSWLPDREYYIQATEQMTTVREGADDRVLVKTTQTFVTDQGDQHGSLREETREQDGLTETRSFSYETNSTDGTITTYTTHTTHDGIVSTSAQTLRHLSGLIVHTVDAVGNEASYQYDPLGRRTSEVVAANDVDYRTQTRWQYQLALSERWMVRHGITDLPHRVWMDERGHVIRREEPLADGSLLVVHELEYDALDQLVREVNIDRIDDGELRLETRYEYDDWGSINREVAPDGSVTVSETTLVADIASREVHRRTRQWQISNAGIRTGWRATYTDAADRRVRAESGTWSGTDEPVGEMVSTWEYDGLGRCVSMTETFDLPTGDGETREVRKVTAQTWDEYDRLKSTTLPDGTVVIRSYAPGQEGELLAELAVKAPGEDVGRSLGSRTWDGLGRLRTETAGSLVTAHGYVPGQLSASTKTMPDGSLIEMSYDRQLQEVLVNSSITDARNGVRSLVIHAAYDTRIGLPTRIESQGGSMDVELDYLGRMTGQSVALNGDDPRTFNAVVTPGGLPVEKTGADGIRQTYSYDSVGRVERLEDASVTIDLAYDAMSRVETRTATSRDGRALVQRFAYDAFGRVASHTWEHIENDAITFRHSLILHWRPDDKLSGKSWYGQTDELVREEAMEYDERGRLVLHTISAIDGEYPLDEMGEPYSRQRFAHDCIDNLVEVETSLIDGRVNLTTYTYDTIDLDRLASIGSSLEGYPGYGTPVVLRYDDNGNVTDDGLGHVLTWDGAGRLTTVALPDGREVGYAHGPDGRVCGITTELGTTYRYREDGVIALDVEPSGRRRYLRTDGSVVAEARQVASVWDVLLLGTDPQGSVITEFGTS